MGNKISDEQRDIELNDAAAEGKADRVGVLLKGGANPNRTFADDKRKSRNSLHQAARTKNNVDVLTKLLDHVKDVDATDEDGNTALHLAAGYYNNAAVVQTLLHAGPNCNIQNSQGQTPLHSAVKGGSDAKIIELLLNAGADPNINDFEGNTALHLCAAMRGVEAMIPGMLLRFSANPNLKNEDGETALHVAAKHGNKAVLLLLKFHAKVRLRDKQGRKPCEVAATDDIRRILEWEEQELEERTVRVAASRPVMTSRASSRNSYFSDGITNGYPREQHVTNHNQFYTSYNSFSSTQMDGQNYEQPWKVSGGDGVIHLPNKSDIVIPPQAIPYGTNLEVKITPPDKGEHESGDLPDFDFEMFNFDFDVTVQLPGVLFVAPWMLDSPVTTHYSVNTSSSPAFTGMCIEGSNKWKSLRELASQPNGILALRFKLSKEKGRPLTYRAPTPSRRSTAEIALQKIPRATPMLSNGMSRDDSVFSDSSPRHDDSADDQAISSIAGEDEEQFGEESHHSRSGASSTLSESAPSVEDKDYHRHEPEQQDVVHKSNGYVGVDQKDFDLHQEYLQREDPMNEGMPQHPREEDIDYTGDSDVGASGLDDTGPLDTDSEQEEGHEPDIYSKLDHLPVAQESHEYEAAPEEVEEEEADPQDRYDRHPIDPALATIHEETQSNGSSDRVQIVEFYDHPGDELQLDVASMRSEPGHYLTPIESESPHSPRYPAEYDADVLLNSNEEDVGTYAKGYDITDEDLESFARASAETQKEERNFANDGRKSSDDVSGSLFF